MDSLAARILIAAVAVYLCACSQPGPASRQLTPAKTDTPQVKATPSKPAAPDDNRPTIVAFGNSLTAGYGLKDSESYPSQLQLMLDTSGYRYRVVNAGVSGDTSAQGLNRIQIVLDYRPTLVIVELGPNDGLRGMPIESTKANLSDIIQQCQKAGANIVLAGMTLPPNYTRAYIQAFERIYVDLAREYQVALIPFFLEGVATRQGLNLDDGIHPNAEGSKIVAVNVLKTLLPLLKK